MPSLFHQTTAPARHAPTPPRRHVVRAFQGARGVTLPGLLTLSVGFGACLRHMLRVAEKNVREGAIFFCALKGNVRLFTDARLERMLDGGRSKGSARLAGRGYGGVPRGGGCGGGSEGVRRELDGKGPCRFSDREVMGF